MEKKLFSVAAHSTESAAVEMQAVERELEVAGGLCSIARFTFTATLGYLVARMGRDQLGQLLERAIVAYSLVAVDVEVG